MTGDASRGASNASGLSDNGASAGALRSSASPVGPVVTRITAAAPRVSASVNGSHTARSSKLDQRRSEEHTSELQSLMRISYAVFCLNKKNTSTRTTTTAQTKD